MARSTGDRERGADLGGGLGEPAGPDRVHRVPRDAVDLEAGADDDAVGDGQDLGWTPVLAKTGVRDAACLAARRSVMFIGAPACGPLTRMASTPRKLALRARSATVREPIELLNSGVMLSNRATPAAPIAAR